MKRLVGILVLILLLAACGQAAEELPPEEPDDHEALIAATPVAQVEGETVSLDGRFEVRAEGASGQYISGIQSPEFLQIVDRETGEVLWQEQGGLWQSALWNEDSGMVALAWSARTRSSVMVIEMENWTRWDFTLPDGSPIPEYTFLPDDEPWGEWGGVQPVRDRGSGRRRGGAPSVSVLCCDRGRAYHRRHTGGGPGNFAGHL